MDVTLQRHCAKYIYIVPDNLRELMSDISREVLRNQPKDIYTFIADYLDALMITRENARVAAKFVRYISDAAETTVELLARTGMTKEEADNATSVIQRAFLSFSHKKGILKDEDVLIAKILEEAHITEEYADESAFVIQSAFREFKDKCDKEKKILSGLIDWRIAARSAIKLYRRTGVSVREAKRAATLIKAAYKGYYTRRTMIKLQEVSEIMKEEETQKPSVEFEDEDDKSKSVRIDYTTVVPRVEFGDNVEIDAEMVDETEQENLEMEEEESTAESVIPEISKYTSTERFVRGIIADTILCPILEEMEDQEFETVMQKSKGVKNTETQAGDGDVVAATDELLHEHKSGEEEVEPGTTAQD